MSNVLSAVAGVGLTGSYVFSQTLFSLRLGVDSCVMGLVVSATSLAIFAVPFNCMAFLPSFYFGARDAGGGGGGTGSCLHSVLCI